MTVVAACAVAHAEVYYSGNGTTKEDFTKAVKWFSDAACTQPVDVNPTVVNTDTWIFQPMSAKLGGGVTLASGGEYHWGDNGDGTYRSSKCSYSQACNAITFNIPYCKVYGCSLTADYGALFKFAGTYEFIDCGQSFAFTCYVTQEPRGGYSNHADLEYAGTFIGDESIVLQCKSEISPQYSAKTILSGDFSSFKGSLKVFATRGMNIVTLTSASAFGSPNEPRGDALVLCGNNKLVIGGGVNQAVGRGVTFDLKDDEVAYIGTENGGSSTFSVPLNGTSGTIAKIDAGTVTLSGKVESKSLEVREGVLVIDVAATLTEGTVINVYEGAELRYALSQKSKFTIIGGGKTGILPFVIDYDPAVEPPTSVLTLAEGFDPQGERIPVRLSQKIALPVNAEMLLPVLEIPGGTLTTGDFVDETEKTYDLPSTSFVLDGETKPGVQIVSLRVNPAVAVQVAKAEETDKNAYSDGRAKHDDGTDYYCDRSELRTGTGSNIAAWGVDKGVFVLGPGCKVFDYCVDWHMGDMRAHAGDVIMTTRASSGGTAEIRRDRFFTGKITVEEDCTDAKPLTLSFSDTKAKNEVSANLHGSGSILFQADQAGTTASAPVVFRVTGENSDFSGRMRYYAIKSPTTYSVLSVTNAAAFGCGEGALDASAIWLDINGQEDSKLLVLQAENSMTIDDANRGWTVSRGTLRQVEGTTFALNSPLTVTGALSKDGAGTLALGGTVTADGKALQVNEGFIQPVNVTSYSGFDIAFADGAGIALDATLTDADLVAKGLVVKSVALADGAKLKVELRNWKPLVTSAGSVRRAILTVPAGTPDLTDSIELIGRGVMKELSRVTEDGLTTYFATYSPSGMIILLK